MALLLTAIRLVGEVAGLVGRRVVAGPVPSNGLLVPGGFSVQLLANYISVLLSGEHNVVATVVSTVGGPDQPPVDHHGLTLGRFRARPLADSLTTP